MRISDWSSDVCSSDLVLDLAGPVNIQSNGGLATGVRSGNSSGNVQIVSRDTLSVTNSDGGAVAVSVAGDAGGAVELAGAVTVAGSDDAVGVQTIGRAACRERVGQYV